MERFKNILVVADEGSATDALFVRASGLAAANAASLTLIDVIDAAPGELARLFSALPGARGHEIEEQVFAAHSNRLDQLAAPLRAQGHEVDTRVLQGVGFLQTIRHVLAHGNDLVLKGAHRAPDRPFLRGADLHLLRKCPCPVWLLNADAAPRSRRIMAAVDPDPDDNVRDKLNRTVMELATSLARQDTARLDVVNAWTVQEESTLRHGLVKMQEREIQSILEAEEQRSAKGLNRLVLDFSHADDLMRVLHLKGNAADVIASHAEDEGIDTLVMGTLGRTGIAGLFIGNTAETILNRVTCSVLAIKPKGFVSPVTLEGAE